MVSPAAASASALPGVARGATSVPGFASFPAGDTYSVAADAGVARISAIASTRTPRETMGPIYKWPPGFDGGCNLTALPRWLQAERGAGGAPAVRASQLPAISAAPSR